MELIDAFRRHGLEVNLYTNGALLDRTTARELVQLGAEPAAKRQRRQLGNAQGDLRRQRRGFRQDPPRRSRRGRVSPPQRSATPYMVYSFVLMEANYRQAMLAVQHAARVGIDAVYFKPLLRDHVSYRYAPLEQRGGGVATPGRRRGCPAGRVHQLELRQEFPLEKDFRTASSHVFSRWPCYFRGCSR